MSQDMAEDSDSDLHSDDAANDPDFIPTIKQWNIESTVYEKIADVIPKMFKLVVIPVTFKNQQ